MSTRALSLVFICAILLCLRARDLQAKDCEEYFDAIAHITLSIPLQSRTKLARDFFSSAPPLLDGKSPQYVVVEGGTVRAEYCVPWRAERSQVRVEIGPQSLILPVRYGSRIWDQSGHRHLTVIAEEPVLIDDWNRLAFAELIRSNQRHVVELRMRFTDAGRTPITPAAIEVKLQMNQRKRPSGEAPRRLPELLTEDAKLFASVNGGSSVEREGIATDGTPSCGVPNVVVIRVDDANPQPVSGNLVLSFGPKVVSEHFSFSLLEPTERMEATISLGNWNVFPGTLRLEALDK